MKELLIKNKNAVIVIAVGLGIGIIISFLGGVHIKTKNTEIETGRILKLRGAK